MVAMIQASFRTSAVAGAGGGDRAPARGGATGWRAVRVPAITGGADGKQGVAGAAHLLAQRDVHGVASAATTAPWTYAPIRGTTDPDGLGRPMESPRWSRGSGGSVRALTSALRTQRTRPARTATPEAVDADGPVDAQTRPPVLAKPRGRGFARASTASVPCLDQETGTEEPDERNPDFYVSTWSATLFRTEW